jgi:hypothetical protein
MKTLLNDNLLVLIQGLNSVQMKIQCNSTTRFKKTTEIKVLPNGRKNKIINKHNGSVGYVAP